ncbi:TIGR02301 family protein [Mesorhizobium sp. BR1-1-16]|uniref:TIGR02301 family protein n=1 Tax=Mesorhizobium sp. BR1-1-16 TaxID=2876653 RepID=UPI001CCF9E0C|nr:TIGR02301 family protein [Mesorhizobium sp. BR1-1-16]MBZ9934861.1 TIGR02301 family protein [Mesorhizobium sp. BR1-1-16]
MRSASLLIHRLCIGAIASMLVAVLLAAASVRAAEPPYDAPLVRLAEILGALHYLRPLCGAAEPTLWRDQMAALVAAEAPSPERRARLTAAFNQGYSGFAALYRSCTPAAIAAVDRYLDEGARLTRDVTTRYGGDAPLPR